MSNKFYVFIMAVVLVASFISCENKTVDLEMNVTKDFGGGGRFIILCIENVDNLKITRTILPKSEKIDYTLNLSQGSLIKIRFEPDEKYKEHLFETEYDLPNGIVIRNQIEYVMDDLLIGSYPIRLKARSSGQEGYEIWDITASGRVTLNIVQ